MVTQGSGGPAGSMEALEHEAAAINSAMRRARGVRLALLLALVVIVGVIADFLYRMKDRLTSDETQKKLIAAVEKNSAPTIDSVMREVQTLATNVQGPVTEAFLKVAKDSSREVLQHIEAERDKLAENLQTKLEEHLNAHHQKLMLEMRGLLREEFPNMKDSDYDRMTANFQAAVEKLLKQHYVEAMKAELKQTYALWDKVPPADPPVGSDKPLEDQLIGHLIELLRLKMLHSGTAKPAS